MRVCAMGVMLAAGLPGLSTGLVQAEPFVFQGQLNDMDAPAEGPFDFEFLLFDADTGGSQIGSVQSIEDLPVSNGNFNAELDFGDDAFDGSPRWVEIRVRPGDSTDAFTLLNPRAKIGSAPQAGFASRSGVADTIVDPFWTQAPGILFFGEDEGDDKVFINRNRVIENTDTFVVHTSNNGLGGMTLSNWAGGMPYYGYATGGFSRAKTYYDPVTDAWVVNKGGEDLLEIDDNDDVIITNNLIVGGTITQLGGGGGGDGGTYIGYDAFTPESIFINFDFTRGFNAFAGAINNQGNTGYIRADMELPHGARITNIFVEYVDRSNTTNLRLELWTRDITTLNFTSEVIATSSGFNSNTVQVFDIVPSPEIVIDNTTTTYALRAFSSAGAWPVAGNLGIRSIRIEYELDLP